MIIYVVMDARDPMSILYTTKLRKVAMRYKALEHTVYILRLGPEILNLPKL